MVLGQLNREQLESIVRRFRVRHFSQHIKNLIDTY